MSSKFQTPLRAQPLPKVCRKPPLPRPPSQPIESLRAYGILELRPYIGPHVTAMFSETLPRTNDDPPYRYGAIRWLEGYEFHFSAGPPQPPLAHTIFIAYNPFGVPIVLISWPGELPSIQDPRPASYANPHSYYLGARATINLLL